MLLNRELHRPRWLILGGTGFIGSRVVTEAVGRGVQAYALVRSASSERRVRRLGAIPIRGDATRPGEWTDTAADADVVIDLLQPELPKRIGNAAARRISRARAVATQVLLDGLEARDCTPLLVSVSGVEDLAPDTNGCRSHASSVVEQPTGFAQVGVPVRRIIEASRLPAVFVHLGIVYGPGKSFAKEIVPDVARGRAAVVGDGNNRLALVHVDDAVAALVHLALLGSARVAGRVFVVADSRVTQRGFMEELACQMAARSPRRVPRWLASLVRGAALVELLTADTPVDTTALVDTGFEFRFASLRAGLRQTLVDLGYATPVRHDAPLALPEVIR
jgi:nucleoside-diphosphate-sugar epimerase